MVAGCRMTRFDPRGRAGSARRVRVAPADARPAAIPAAMLTLLASVALWRLDLLRGPTLWDSGHAMAEIVPAIVVGTVGGYRYARCGASG